jgi:predicted dehydrogenase
MDPVRVALVGCGNFARWQHLPNLLRLPEARLTALCDPDQRALAAAGSSAPEARRCSDAAAVWADPEIEAVVIAVRDDLQAGLAEAALAAGKHVYVEKPLAAEPGPIARVAAAERRAGRICAVGFQKRFAPIYGRARAAAAACGGLRNAVATMTDDAWRWARGYPPGYLLVHDLCHLVDLVRFLTGQEVATVYAAAGRPDDDALVLRCAGGALATIVGSGHGSMDMPKERFDGICERGGFSAHDYVELRTFGIDGFPPVERFAGHSVPGHGWLHRPLFEQLGLDGMLALRRIAWEERRRPADPADPYDAERRAWAEATLPNFLRDQGWMAAMRAFLAAVRGAPRGDLAGPADALAAARVCAAALASRTTGQAVAVAEDAAHAA